MSLTGTSCEAVVGGKGEYKRGRTPSPLAVKVYVVLQTMNLARDGEPNSRIIATRLTREAADEVKDKNPGTWVEKHVAVK